MISVSCFLPTVCSSHVMDYEDDHIGVYTSPMPTSIQEKVSTLGKKNII